MSTWPDEPLEAFSRPLAVPGRHDQEATEEHTVGLVPIRSDLLVDAGCGACVHRTRSSAAAPIQSDPDGPVVVGPKTYFAGVVGSQVGPGLLLPWPRR